MSSTIWIVYGAEGEYSDHSEWPVAWFKSSEDAAAFATRLNESATAAQAAYERIEKAQEEHRAAAHRAIGAVQTNERLSWDWKMPDGSEVDRDTSNAIYKAAEDAHPYPTEWIPGDPSQNDSKWFRGPRYYSIEVKRGTMPAPFEESPK